MLSDTRDRSPSTGARPLIEGGQLARGNPERIFEARKAATIERLVGDGIRWLDVVACIRPFEGGAGDLHDLRRDGSLWQNAHDYVRREFDAGRTPPRPPDVTREVRDLRI